MAIFGNLDIIKKQVNSELFYIAFDYLDKVLDIESIEYNRLKTLPINAFEKEDLSHGNFALEQVYQSKTREQCFFESHKAYIDVQFILEGEEIIEINNTDTMEITMPYDSTMDLIKYDDNTESSKIILKKGAVAIFYPEDAHMPCVQMTTSSKVIKTVIKVPINV